MDNATSPFVINDEIFTIVAHPLRRKILQALFENTIITFTTLSVEWNLVTGTIYHHLKILGSLVSKDDTNIYHLTEEGIKVCEWFLNSKSGRSSVNKIDSFTLLTYSLESIIENNSRIVLILGLLISLIGILSASSLGVQSLGTFIFPNGSSNQKLIILNILSTLGMILFLLSISWVFSNHRIIHLEKLFVRFLLSLLPSNIIVLILYVLNLVFIVELNLNSWIIISFINQVFFLFVLSSTMINVNGFSIEKSAFISLISLYVQLFAVFLLI